MTNDAINLCFNSLQISAPEDTINRFLQHGFSLSEPDDWGASPQNFSFQPFGKAAEERKDIWSNWIEVKNVGQQQQLLLEFESGESPPFSVIHASIEWLRQQDLPFDLHYRYRLENESWDGEIRESHPS